MMTQDERDPLFLWSPVNSLKGTLISEFPVDCIICIHINFPNRCHLPGSSNCFSLTPSFSCCPPYLEYWNLEEEIGSVLCAATLVSWNLELVSLTLVAYLQGKSFLFFFSSADHFPSRLFSVVVYVFLVSETWSVLQLFPLYYFLLKSYYTKMIFAFLSYKMIHFILLLLFSGSFFFFNASISVTSFYPD